MAQIAGLLGYGGQRFVEDALSWCRQTIRKGKKELLEGKIVDNFSKKGRNKSEVLLPNLLNDIKAVADPVSQTDPTFKSTWKYIPITAKEVHRRLQESFSYTAEDLPCVRTISNKLADLGFKPSRVQKCKPLKKIPETDAIFDEVHRVNKDADVENSTVRISLDCKAVVAIGEFSRGGLNRIVQKALDHDFAALEKLTPFGILEPKTGKSFIWFSKGPATSDFQVDCIEELLCDILKKQPNTKRLVINADNGPDCSGRRTQWLNRLSLLSLEKKVKIDLAYYPPYHSKYNPVERLWGVLENHWRGQLLSSVDKALGFAKSMTYKGISPVVKLVEKVYEKGVTLTKKEMIPVEQRLTRKSGLEKYFIRISAEPQLG